MKTINAFLTLMLLGSIVCQAEQQKDFGFNILSVTEPSLDGTVSISVQYFVYKTCTIPNPNLTCTMNGATLTNTDPALFIGVSYTAGSQFTATYSLNYDVNTLPYYPKSFSIQHATASQKNAAMGMVYITPYNTVEIWNMADFNNLPRTWIAPVDGTTEPTRIFVDPSLIPVSDIPANYAPTESWQTDFHEVIIPGLAYSIPMLPEEPGGPTDQAYESGDDRADGCGVGRKRWKGYISGSIKGYLKSNLQQENWDHPLKGIKVEIWDEGVGELFNHKLAETHTDMNGNYSVWVDVCKLGEGNEMEIFLKIFSESDLGSDRKIKVKSNALVNIHHRGDRLLSATQSWYYNEGDQLNLNMGSWTTMHESFTVCHLANTAWHFASDYSGKTIEDNFIILTYRQNCGTCITTSFLPDKICGVSFQAILDVIVFERPHMIVSANDGYDENTIWHEFGHFVMWHLQDKCWTEPISGGYASHSYTAESNPRIAWTEGWADGFSQIVDLHYSYYDNEYTLEQSGWNVERGFASILFYEFEIGYNSEFAIASAIYDLYDGPENTDHLNFQAMVDDSESASAWDNSQTDDAEFTFAEICKPIWDGKANGYNGQLENVMDYINGLYREAGCSSDRHYIKKCFDNNYVVYDVNDRWNTGSSSDQITQTTWASYEGTGEPPFDNAPYYFELDFENELSVIDEFGESFNFIPPTIPSIHGRISDNIVVKTNGDLYLNNQTLPGRFIAGSFPNPPGGMEANIDVCPGTQIEVKEAGSIVLGDDIDNTVNLTILADARLWINSAGYCLLYPNSKITIEDRGLLQISNGTVRMHPGASIIINPGGKLLFEGGEVFVNGSESKIVLAGGIFEVADNKIFQMLVDIGEETGYVEVTSAIDHELIMGQNAEFKLLGSGQADLILKITDWVNLWETMETGAKMYLENGRVELTNNGQLWTGLRFDAENVLFEDNSSLQGAASINVWWNGCYIDDCVFNNVRLFGYHSNVRIDDSFFNTITSGVSVMWGSYRISQSFFTSCGIISTSLDAYSLIEGCSFEGGNGMWNNATAVEDKSIVRIRFNRSVVDGGEYGISKTGGELIIRCSQFFNCSRSALWMKKGSSLSMSTGDYGGYNIFNSNEYNITFLSANTVNLSRGFNQLAEFGSMNIVGTLAGFTCGPNCQVPLVVASGNIWSTDQTPVGPDQQYIQLETTSQCFLGPCQIAVIDFNPTSPTTCGAGDGGPQIIKPEKSKALVKNDIGKLENEIGDELYILKSDSADLSNPLIYTTNFDGWQLDSALIFAAGFMEIYDSTKNDMDAIALFHEIFHSGIELHHPEIEWKLDWARTNMKVAVENLFLQDDLTAENNQTTFQAPVAQYVDVLNLVTDSMLTDSSMRHQFYLELDKAQLFKTLGMPLVTRELLDRIDDCSLDSLEQATLNTWLELVDQEISIADQLQNDSIALDSLDFTVDTEAYNSPVEYLESEYYFGAWISSPTDIVFMQCNEFGYKVLISHHSNVLEVWPQPAQKTLNIESNIGELGIVSIHNINGAIIFNRVFDFREKERVTFELPQSISPGIYTLSVSSNSGIESKRILIQ